MPKAKEDNIIIHFFLVYLGILFCFSGYYIIKRATEYDSLYILNLVIPLIAGIVYENLRISKNWKHTILKIFGALILSLCAFNTDGLSAESISDTLKIWAYSFVGIFSIISVIYHDEKAITPTSKGLTLMLSISFIYWVISIYGEDIINHYLIVTTVILLSLVTIYYSFSLKKLSNNNKLLLSVWGSVMVMVFSVDTFFSFIKSENYKSDQFSVLFSNYIEYFILGVSLIYLIKNAEMILSYSPSRGDSIKTYIDRIRKTNKEHINRYSDKHLKRKDVVFALVIIPFAYILNYFYAFVEPRILIWWVFIFFPILNNVKNLIQEKTIALEE